MLVVAALGDVMRATPPPLPALGGACLQRQVSMYFEADPGRFWRQIPGRLRRLQIELREHRRMIGRLFSHTVARIVRDALPLNETHQAAHFLNPKIAIAKDETP